MNVVSRSLDLFEAVTEHKPLRPHQIKAIALAKEAIRQKRKRPVICLPTGAGKTRIAAEIIHGALAKGNRVAFTVPAISLVDQTVDAFEAQGIYAIGVMQASHGRTDARQPVQVVSVQTIARRGYPDADVVIVDECHLRFKAVSEWMHCAADKVFIGLSATPWAKGMGDDWQELITPVRMQELIDAGYLSPFRVYAPSAPDLSRVRMVAGDYHEGDLSEAVSNLPLIADIVETWKKHAVGLPTLVFAVNKAHAALLVRQFAAGGVQMGYCDDRVDPVERSYMFAQVRSGHLAGIVNIGTLTTGVDEDIRCIVLARPTRSQMLFVQMIGRGLRTAPGKRECVILDHADNHHRMGMVTDIYFPELLTGKDKPHKTASESGEAMPQACASCHFVKPPKTPICPSCGFKAERQSEIETEDGKLVEFKKPKAATMQDKQEFWSMALYVDRQRQKGGRLAKALYKSKFGVWPKNLNNWTCPPSAQFERYEHSRRIAFAKSRGA